MRERPEPFGDPLSSVLSLLRVDGTLSVQMEFGGDWAFDCEPVQHIKFGLVVKGGFWIEVDDRRVPLSAGDCYLLSGTGRYRIGTDLDLPALDAHRRFAADEAGIAVARYGAPEGEAETVVISSRFTFEPGSAGLLLEWLPPLIHLKADPRAASALQMVQALLAEEIMHRRVGSAMMADRLAQIVLIQVLRAYLDSNPERPTGWLGAMGEPGLGAALRLIHAEPSRPWTLVELAKAAGMSRSSFALRFKDRVGVAPMAYMARWRMHVAARALGGDRTVASVAHELGYASESAFSTAFKRIMGIRPSSYRVG